MAEVIARYQLEQLGLDWQVCSAGTEGVDGAPISENARIVCAEAGLSLAGKARQALKEDLVTSDRVFVAMEDQHRDFLMDHFGITEDRIFVLEGAIVNPRFGDLETYRLCKSQIVTEVGNILRFLKSIEKDKVRLYFVRHAKSDQSVREDPIRPLTPEGQRDALKVTAVLKDKGITKVYSSPYARARDTVCNLAATLGLDIVQVDDLRERVVGGWVDDFPSYAGKQWEDFSYKNPGGESLAEVQERSIKAVQAIIEENLGSSVAIGTHGTALSTILNYFDSDFGYADFYRIVDRMPYILCLTLDRANLISVREVAV
ncbi:MAG: histidine phosphatase family protein [Limnochordia bacterium]|jgi:2,3-bisphosphoglycerate-dependent phosphoglycerate mutase|nr:histidine phosphatase family protein [Limnochordia bacterium]